MASVIDYPGLTIGETYSFERKGRMIFRPHMYLGIGRDDSRPFYKHLFGVRFCLNSDLDSSTGTLRISFLRARKKRFTVTRDNVVKIADSPGSYRLNILSPEGKKYQSILEKIAAATKEL